jgi:hypothetical protein
LQELPLHGLQESHLLLQQAIPLQLGHGAQQVFGAQQPLSHGAWVAQPASNKALAAIAIKPVFIIHFPLYFKLKTKSLKKVFLTKTFTDMYYKIVIHV